MRMQHLPAPGGLPATQLWVMLPGAYMKPADFIEAGFADAVRERGLPHQIALLEADLPDVADGSALAFLQSFLCADSPATAHLRVCVLGISLGAHLALACLARACHGGHEAAAAARVASACLLAPYLGPRDIIAEAESAGQPAGRSPAPPHSDIDRRIWQWLQREAPAHGIHLGYGSEDRFAKGHALMARSLGPGRVDVQPGGHAWPVWTALWNRHLDRNYARH
ncbi:MAG: hypothetical protein H0X13_14485 [Ramlibacter sp.]|nr:hypothetical protein [Ramlibacter sp.]